MKNKWKWFTIIVIVSIARTVLAQDYPDEFSDFFEEQVGEILIISPLGYKVNASSSYTFEKVIPSESSKRLIIELLTNDNVNNVLANKIISSFSDESKYKSCDDNKIETCSSDDEEFSYIFDYDRKILKINVSSEAFNQSSSKKRYANINSDTYSFISKIDVNSNVTDDSSSVNLSLDNVVNMNYGYFVLSGDISSNDSYIDESSYSLDLENETISIGYYKNSRDGTNRASDLRIDPNSTEYSLSISNSDNLTIGTESSYQRFYFNMPKKGMLELSKDGKILFTRQYEAGQGFISYDSLPYGKYELTYKIIIDGRVIESRNVTIYNTKSSIKNKFDYQLDIGFLERNKNTNCINCQEYEIKDISNSKFISLTGRYSLSPVWDVYTQVVNSQGNNASVIGFLNEGIHHTLDINRAFLDKGNYYLNGYFKLYDFVIDYEKYENNSYNNYLSRNLFGDENYERLGVSFNRYIDLDKYSFPSGNLYIGYSENNRSDPYFYSRFSNSYVGYSFRKLGVDYDFSLNSNSEEFYASLNVNLPLDQGYNFDSNSYVDEKGNFSVSNNLSKNIETNTEELDFSMSVYNRINSNINSTSGVTLDGSYMGDKSRAFISGSYDDDGFYGYGNVSTNIVSTEDAFSFTSERSDSYMIIKSNVYGDETVGKYADLGTYELTKNTNNFEQGLINKKTKILPVAENSLNEIYIDTESSNLENSGERYSSYFSHKGTVHPVNIDLRAIKSFVVSFENILGDKVSDIKCIGDGCSSYAEVGDGVFSLSIKSGMPFKILSSNGVCIVEQEEFSKSANLGVATCLPSIDTRNNLQLVTNGLGTGYDNQTIFIGSFDKKQSNWVYNRLLKYGNVIQRQDGNSQLLFLRVNDFDSLSTSSAKEELAKLYEIESKNLHESYVSILY